MRQLSEFEKQIVERLIKGSIGNISSFSKIIDPILNNVDIVLDYTTAKVELKFDTGFYTQGTLINVVREVNINTIIIVNLMNYLQSNGYVVMFDESPRVNTKFGQLVAGHNSISASVHDSNTEKLILDFAMKSILIQQPLIDYFSQGFKTKEELNTEKEHNQQKIEVRIALTALIVSVLLCGLEICIGVYHVDEIKKELKTEHIIKLNDTQFKTLDSNLCTENNLIKQQTSDLNNFSQKLIDNKQPKKKK